MSKHYSSSHGDLRRKDTGESDGNDTIYGTTPSSSSPTHSSPTFTESVSNSASHSSSSPPDPITPARVNRPRPRYPDLGRVPLHRRGTSRKYEALEDLLKEAGYKETRIFTPETERSESHGNINGGAEDKRLSMMDGMGAVVGFFAGLIPSATTNKTGPQSTATSEESGPKYTTSPQEYSPPLSPLAGRYKRRNATQTSFDSSVDAHTPTYVTSSVESLQDQTPKAAGLQSISRANSPAPTVTHPTYYQDHPPLIIRNPSLGQQVRKQTSRTSIARPSNNNHNNLISPRPSRAGAYLRHMSSVQTLPERPNSTPVHSSTKPRIQINDSDMLLAHGPRGNGEGEVDAEPPLPPTWLESVARAVLFGGSGAYVGGPSFLTPSDHPRHASASGSASPKVPRVQVLRPTRSSLSQTSRRPRQPTSARSGLSDQTNTTRVAGGFLVPPPPLFSKIERGRAGRSEGEVAHTRVVCRSAPGSRMGSPVRDDAREKLRQQRGRSKQQKKGSKDRVPSLARTHAENDIWARQPRPPRPDDYTRHSTAGGWGMDAESDSMDATAPSSEDEDEGELNLARMLVHPKRQNSIKSLRKHLAAQNASAAQATMKHITAAMRPGGARTGPNVVNGGPPSVPPLNSKARRAADGDAFDGEVPQEWGGGWQRRGPGRAHSEDDDDLEGFMRAERFGSGRSTGKRRTGFAGAWGS